MKTVPLEEGREIFPKKNLGGSSNTLQTANIRENRTPSSLEQALNPEVDYNL